MSNVRIRILWWEILSKPRKFFKLAQPFILSHHPDCEKFRDHYFVIGKYKLCIGCFFAVVPAIAVSLVLIFIGFFSRPFSELLRISFAIILAGGPIYLIGLKNKYAKALGEYLIAQGAGILVLSIFFSLEASFSMRFLLALLVYQSILCGHYLI